ncbi:MAG TPA: Ig-like domain-containing protein, partial [Chloroflexota bacterium]|nr:Ig-like domain-containing protein [Chloroflexota bacterium]
MNRLLRLPLIVFVLLMFTAVSCREEEKPTPNPTPTTIAITPTPAPTPFLLDLGAPLPPQVIGQHPAAGEEAPLDGAFEVYFDQPMQPDTAVQVTDDNGEEIVGDITWPQPRILRFKPAQPLQPDGRYQLSVDSSAISTEGLALVEGLTLDFYTIGDLAVSQISPANGVTNVAVDSTITVIFNRPVVPLMVGEEAANLPNPLVIEPAIPGQGEWVNTSVYVYRPAQALIGRQAYTVRVDAAAVNAISATGAQMVKDEVSSFTVTPPTFDFLELVDSAWNPQNGWQNLPLDQSYRLHFNQPMDAESTETAVTLQPSGGGNAIPFTYAWDSDFLTLTLTPTQLLALSTVYQLTLDDSAQSASGGTLARPFTWSASTVKYPAIRRTEPANGQTESHYSSVFRIEFSAPMDEESMAGKVIISPDIIGDPDGLYSPWNWSQNYYGFRPSTTYTVQILPGMKDVYGNEISAGQTLTFTTGKLPPSASLNLPYSVALYRSGGSDSLWVTHQNITELDVDLYQLSLSEFGKLLHYDLSPYNYMPQTDQRLWQRTLSVNTPLNELRHRRFILNQEDTGPLPTGFYFVALDSPQISHSGHHLQAQVLAMATANVTLKTTATEAMMWATDLNSGEPLPGVPVALYDKRYQLVFEGTTDAFGLVYRDDLDLVPGWNGRYYAIVGEPGSDVFGLAVSNWNEGISTYDFGIYTDFYLEPNQPTGYIYTERPVYRPGQPVYFKGIVRLNDDLTYALPDFQSVNVQIASYDETVYTATLPLNEFGSFSGEITLDDEAALGNYWIGVTTADNQTVGNGYFEVAEFRKPTFQVEVTANETDVAAGETIEIAIDARFFSGGAVVNGAVEWHVRSEDYTFTGGPDLRRYDFRNQERDRGAYYYDYNYQPTQVIAEGVGQTDGQGRLLLQIPAELQ